MANSKTGKTVSAALLLLGTSVPAVAQDISNGFYGRLFGGASFLSDSSLSGAIAGSSGFDTGQVYGVALGYDYEGSPWRSELEFAYRTADPDGTVIPSGDFASTTFALNGYYSFSPIAGGNLTPYVGAGLAYATEIDFDVTGGAAAGEYSDTGLFAYQLMVGAEYALNDRWSLNGEVRYFDAGSQTLKSATGRSLRTSYESVDLIIGTTFKF